MSGTGAKMAEPAPGSWSRKRLLLLTPLAIFLGLALLFLSQLRAGDPSKLPSVLIDQPVPDFALPQLEGFPGQGLSDEMLADGVHVVNVWASWCGPCRDEHPFLMTLSKDKRFKLAGLNYKDKAENARRFLGALGNPYAAIGVDARGRTTIDWGVYGVPETFIVKDGTIVHKFVGPLSAAAMAENFGPALEKALKMGPAEAAQ
jgi:cytochrome c biogenesis protein CcmG/thiol:disulfide interchange protein DsbE